MIDYVDIAFVILHYNTFQETKDCIESIIKNIDTDKYHIIIVDNCSINDSSKKLSSLYNDNSRISLIVNNKNLGFAKGNNVGINYAKESLHAEFVCCLNNDTIMKQKDFLHTLREQYSIEHPAVIGPKVILRDNSVQKIKPKLLGVNEYRRQLCIYQMIMNKSFKQKLKENLLKYKWIRKLKDFKHNISDEIKIENDDFYQKQHMDILLHGCCLIFTPSFFEVMNGLCEETFLYYEEEILYLDLLKKGLHNLYCPELVIYHLEDAATNSIANNEYEKKMFVTKHKMHSVQILLNHLIDN